MPPTIQILVFLLVVLAAVAWLAERLKTPPSILLVITGVVLALIPGLPRMEMAPEFVLLIVLPPVIYSASVAMSWREFKLNLRPIGLLAIGCVLFTTVAVAAAAHWALGLSWPLGLTLGAIVSPPDAVAPLSIARRLGMPRRLMVILEGEGLANDATALILYRFAVAAVSVGTFSLGQAVGTFAAIVVGEIVWGIGVGWAMLHLRRWVRDTRIEILLSVLTPFLAYWPPEQLGGSGVLATVATGLFISWNGLRLISAATRLQGVFFWDFLIYVIEGMVFLITGLQAHALINSMSRYPWTALVLSGVVVSAVVIVSRFVWMYPATYLPRLLSTGLRRRDPSPPWQWPFALAFTGIRGIVSLAAALAIPLTTQDGAAFPHRDLILFVTFFVILVTLVGQGLLMPWVVGALGLIKTGRRERRVARREEFKARRLAVEAANERLEQLAEQHGLTDEALAPLRARHSDRLQRIDRRGGDDEAEQALMNVQDEIEFGLIEAERTRINDLYRKGKLRDEARRRIERDLDLREANLVNVRDEG
jgi:CPA1 family monovalent cation:H+ antiporter